MTTERQNTPNNNIIVQRLNGWTSDRSVWRWAFKALLQPVNISASLFIHLQSTVSQQWTCNESYLTDILGVILLFPKSYIYFIISDFLYYTFATHEALCDWTHCPFSTLITEKPQTAFSGFLPSKEAVMAGSKSLQVKASSALHLNFKVLFCYWEAKTVIQGVWR